MAIGLPARARVVIVGGGVIGCSVAYHLSKLGWSDIVLLERKQLTSGTTWHAAGLIGQLRQSVKMTQLARYTSELYRGLEAETGQATGYRQCGSVSVATTTGRMEELRRNAGPPRPDPPYGEERLMPNGPKVVRPWKPSWIKGPRPTVE